MTVRTWTVIGDAYTSGTKRAAVTRTIEFLEWHTLESTVEREPPFFQAHAVRDAIRQLDLRGVLRVAWSSQPFSNQYPLTDAGEVSTAGIYGVECDYGHRQLRIYLLDRGMFTVVLATDVWATAPRTPTATA
ncbi:MAG TPA: hypothetical protein VGY76_10690 [Solirubrobacteraceae bacterium]|nr:hypothetical protein [Solirubrobacteraceae bacterium]